MRFADPLLVAYHYEAAAFLLPYTTGTHTRTHALAHTHTCTHSLTSK